MKTIYLLIAGLFMSTTLLGQINIRNMSSCTISYQVEEVNAQCDIITSWSGSVSSCNTAVISTSATTHRVRVSADGSTVSGWHGTATGCVTNGCEGINGCAASSDVSFDYCCFTTPNYWYVVYDGASCTTNSCP